MFSPDERAGNILTTIALFGMAAVILYLARGALLVLLLSLLFAYLLEPAVSFFELHFRLGRKSRTWAVALVYLIGTVLVGSLGYEFGPHIAAQIKNLSGVVREILEGHSSAKAPAGLGDLWASQHDVIARLLERCVASAATVAANAVWIFAIPILAIFFLLDGRAVAGATVEALESRGDPTRVKRILQRVDRMLARYIRAQLALAGLSFAFYSVCMLILGFPYAIALGALGGVLEFLPAVGWVASAVAILSIGFLTHSHWIWMAVLIAVWRVVQDYVNSPRIMGDKLELRPLTVIIALMVGGQAGGVAGLYLAVPTVALLRIVWTECFQTQKSSISPSDQPHAPAKA